MTVRDLEKENSVKGLADTIEELPGRLQSGVFLYLGALLTVRAAAHFSGCYSGFGVLIAQWGAFFIHIFLTLLACSVTLPPILKMAGDRRWAKNALIMSMSVLVLPIHLMFLEFVTPMPEGDECSAAAEVPLVPGFSLRSN